MSNLSNILILSNSPHEYTGYGKQTRYLCRILTDLGYKVGVVALHGLQGPAIHWQDIPIFGQRESRYTLDEMRAYVEYFEADAVITLYDLWHFPADTAQLIHAPWIAMMPVEGYPIHEGMVRFLRTASYVVTYSQFGHDVLEQKRLPSTLIQHCLDPEVYKPGNVPVIREDQGMPMDKYIVTMVAMNKGRQPYRKAWPQMLQAWKRFTDAHDDVFLYCHTNTTPIEMERGSGFRFGPLVDDLGIDWSTLGFPDRVNWVVGMPDEGMARMYAASNAVILPSMAEGFGLPVIEAQACGTPILAHDCSAMTELVHNGYLIPRGPRHWINERKYWWHRPRVGDIYDVLERAYDDFDSSLEDRGPMGRQAMIDHYSIEAVTPLWDEFLAHVGRELW